MDQVGVLLGSFAFLGLVVEGLVRKVAKSARRFPTCKTCGFNMTSEPLPNVLPDEIQRYLDKYQLPAAVASRFLCPKRHYQLWFIPKLGNTERAFFLREDL
jgi:hypothetical protein